VTDHQGRVFAAVTWNLFHGRDFPPEAKLLSARSRLFGVTEYGETYAQVNRSLLPDFGQVLDELNWEVALLQEAPQRWLEQLRGRCQAAGELGATSRNRLAWARTAVARMNPDLIASNEGGSNMVLVRSPGAIEQVERHVLATRPEPRALLLARVTLPGGERLAVACTHLSVPSTGQGGAELLAAAERAVEFAGSDPLLLGGDLNLRPSQHAEAFAEVERRFGLAPPTPGEAIDHLLVRGLDVVYPPKALADAAREVPGPEGLRIRLSDHPPVAAGFGVR
jgi:endonuclease/exonuclease/phosphatase family metal-dependent hydrolase